MIGRKIKVQIAVFLAIAILGTAYAGAKYARLDALFGSRGYTVTVQFINSGGIFTNAEVTYRGVAVGRVAQLHLTDTGVAADLDLENNAPKIPANAHAIVANRSAVGEQYVDLQPENDQGPRLSQGSVIPSTRTQLPPRPEDLLTNVDRLTTSVPTGSLRTVVNELDNAFTDTGPDLQQLLDTSRSFTDAASEHLPQTVSLLAHGRQVLDTQEQLAQPITDFSHNLNQLADQLQTSDGDVRRLISAAPPVANQINDILTTSGPKLGGVLANLLTTMKVTSTRADGIEQALVGYPIILGEASTAVDPGGFGHLGLNLNIFDPPVCTTGYEGTKRRAGSDTTTVAPNNSAYCAQGPGSPTNVRGAQNAPSASQSITPPPR